MSSGRNLINSLPHLEGGAEDLLDFVWTHGVDGMLFIGEDNKVLAANPTICAWLGRTESELQTMTWLEFTRHEDIDKDLVAVREVLAGVRDRYSVVKYYTPQEERPFPARLTVTAWRDSNGKRVLMFYSQIQRVDTELIRPESDIEVVWRLIKDHPKKFLLGLLLIAASGEGLSVTIKKAFEWLGEILPMIL